MPRKGSSSPAQSFHFCLSLAVTIKSPIIVLACNHAQLTVPEESSPKFKHLAQSPPLPIKEAAILGVPGIEAKMYCTSLVLVLYVLHHNCQFS